MKPIRAELLLLVVTIFWGSSYLFMKMGLDSLGEFNLIALRFGIAFILAAVIFSRRLRHINLYVMKYSMLLGFILFLVFVTITFGLNTTTTSNAGFLVSLTVVFVPLINTLILKKKIEMKLTISIILAITGIALLTLHFPVAITPGDLLCIIGAFFYAIHIIVVGQLAQKADTLTLGILQLGFAGLFGFIFAFIFETPVIPNSTTSWVSILVLSIFCSAVGFILQVIAQKYTSPARTGLIFSLEPVFAALFGYLFAHEFMSISGYIGASLVLLSIIISTSKFPSNRTTLEKEYGMK
ncbi:DMT family transporter [Peribacillus deserti]|uniref:EamA family transporter n=1 Tax=Peribacillus deserti TaxID=673318 RepID=A0A2N5M2R3_9BACI|nr:DMT family transporter [Peribacillus deserti]PLT28650.1 EamA family transporter [Peribacillus deserti]